MSAKEPLICSSCGHRFELATDEPRRCPSCMRSSGLIAADSPEAAAAAKAAPAARPAGRALVIAAAGLASAAIAVSVWFFVGRGDADEPRPDAQTQGPVEVEVPSDLAERPDEVTGDIKLAASKLPSEADAIVAAVREARKAGKLPERTPEDDMTPETPEPAAALVGALQGKTVPLSGSLEATALAGALMKARGIEGVQYGVDEGEKHAKTTLVRRRYVVRAGDGPWLAVDGDPVDAAKVRALGEPEFLANLLAFRALAAMDDGDGDGASRAIGVARKLDEQDPAIRFTSGVVQLFNGLTDIGLSEMDAVAKEHGDAMTWLMLGQYAAAADQSFRAHQYLRKAAATDPGFAEPWVMLAQVALDRMDVTPKADRPPLVKEIRGDVDKAEAIDAKAFGIRTIKAQLAVLDGDQETAEKLMKEEVELHPRNRGAWLAYANYYIGQDRAADALAVLEEADKKGVTGAEIHILAGQLHANAGDSAAALLALEKALAIDPADPRLRPQLAQMHNLMGDAERARALLDEQVKRFPDDAHSRMLIAQLALNQKDFATASKQLERIAKDLPDDPRPVVLLYIIALNKDEGVEAARERAVQVLGKRSELAQILLEQGILTEAEKLLREAVEKEPDDEEAPYMLAAMLAALGRDAEVTAFVQARLKAIEDEEDRKKAKAQFELAVSEGRAQAGKVAPTPESPEAPAPDSPSPAPDAAPSPGSPGAPSSAPDAPPSPGSPGAPSSAPDAAPSPGSPGGPSPAPDAAP